MTARFNTLLALTSLMFAISTLGLGSAQAQPGKGKTREKAIEAAVEYLKSAQEEEGTWSKVASPGVTPIVITGLFQSGGLKADDPAAAKALKFIEGMADAKEGNFGGSEQRLKNYVTGVSLVALKASGSDKYAPLAEKAAVYLKKSQRGAEDGLKPEDLNFGGYGYNSTTRADLSNTHVVLDGLKAAGTPKHDPVYKRAAVFVSRMQNFKSEVNDQPWAGKINDGSFIYVLTQPGAKGNPDDPKPGYGSMTAAGLKGLLYCGVDKSDPRVKKAVEWLGKNYSVDINPGRDSGAGGQGYYYYLLALAECFDALGEEEFTDAVGKKHDWRAEITRALMYRQKKDGSWSNDFTNWMETNPHLCTGYALQTLAICKPKVK